MYGLLSCPSAAPSWVAAALCIVGLCVALSCAVCVWRKCLKNKDKDKEKDKEKDRGKEKGKEKNKVDLDTEMDGGYSKVRVHWGKTTHEKHTLSLPPADASPLQCIHHEGQRGVIELSVLVTDNGCVLHFSCSCEGCVLT